MKSYHAHQQCFIINMKVEGVHLSDYIESESDSGMKRFSLQDGQMSNCMLSARFLWYKAIIIKPFLFFPEKSVGYFIAEQNIFLILYLKKYSL